MLIVVLLCRTTKVIFIILPYIEIYPYNMIKKWDIIITQCECFYFTIDTIDYESRIARMINRNCGIRVPTREDKEREPKNEIITSRVRDDAEVDNGISSSLNGNFIENDLPNTDEDTFSKAEGVGISIFCNN